jgi:hypothetical protein
MSVWVLNTRSGKALMLISNLCLNTKSIPLIRILVISNLISLGCILELVLVFKLAKSKFKIFS